MTKSKLADQRIIIFGAGSAGLGIAKQVRDAMVETDGLSKEDASAKFWLIDRDGLILKSMSGNLRKGLEEFSRNDNDWVTSKGENGKNGGQSKRRKIDLLEVVQKVKPTVLIGCSTVAGAFSENVVRAMAEGCERPIILPLSNPSKLIEVDPKDANNWTEGKALMATGSPFPPTKNPNGKEYM